MFNIIGLLVVGLIIGAIARLIKPGRQALGFLGTLLLGVAGAVIGGLIASYFGVGKVTELNVPGFIAAVVVAFLLIGVAEATVGKNKGAARR